MATLIRRSDFSYLLLSLILLAALFVTIASTPTTTSSQNNLITMPSSLKYTTPAPDSACTKVNCLQGTCQQTDSLLGFDCECYHGWTKPLGLPFCILPNCSINMTSCGNETLPPAPPPVAPTPFALPFTPCFLVWCGDGQCIPGNSINDHTCQCNDHSANLLGNMALPCFNKCNLGADCSDLQIGPPVSPPPPPPAHSAAAPGNGFTSAFPPSCSREYKALSTALVIASATISIWI